MAYLSPLPNSNFDSNAVFGNSTTPQTIGSSNFLGNAISNFNTPFGQQTPTTTTSAPSASTTLNLSPTTMGAPTTNPTFYSPTSGSSNTNGSSFSSQVAADLARAGKSAVAPSIFTPDQATTAAIASSNPVTSSVGGGASNGTNSGGTSGNNTTGFNPDVPNTIPSTSATSGMTYQDVLNARQGLMQDYQQALQNYANTQTASNLANFNAQYSGDTEQFGTGMKNLVGTQTAIANQNALLNAQNYGNLLGANAQTAQLIPGQYMQVSPGNQVVGIGQGQPQSVYGGLGSNSQSGSTQGGGTTLQSLAQVANTQGWNTALSMLGSYANDPNTVNQLYQATQAINPNFNINQSNAQATATNTNVQKAGDVQAALTSANAVVSSDSPNDTTTLLGAFNALNPLQKSGSSLVNTGVDSLISLTGQGGLAQYQNWKTVLSEARARVSAVLSAGVNLGIVGNNTTANDLLPDNMTQASLTQHISAIQSLESKVAQAYGNPSNSTAGGSSSVSNGFPIGTTAGGGAFIMTANGWAENPNQ